jgi:hypothetical protein
MAVFNAKDRIIECKLVYYGPGRGGKTTNLEYIFKAGQKYTKSDMVSINTKGDRTLFFDFLPIGYQRRPDPVFRLSSHRVGENQGL